MSRFRQQQQDTSPHFTSNSYKSQQSNQSVLIPDSNQLNINTTSIFSNTPHSNNEGEDDFYSIRPQLSHLHEISNQQHHLLPHDIYNDNNNNDENENELYSYYHNNPNGNDQQQNHHQQQQDQTMMDNNNDGNNITYHHHRRWYNIDEAHNYNFTICNRFKIPSIRQFALFHYFQFIAHIFVLFNAMISALLTFFDSISTTQHNFFHVGIILFMIVVDLYMSFIYYQQRKYAPYSLSSPFLYIKQKLILLPNCPDVLFLSDKLGLLCQGYLFVVLPYLNILTLVYTPNQSSQQRSFNFISNTIFGNGSDNNVISSSSTTTTSTDLLFQIKLIFIYIVLFQLIITLWTWLAFCLFYTIFIYEVFLRSVFFILCCFRSRSFTIKISTNNHTHYNNNGETRHLLSQQQPQHEKQQYKTKFIADNIYHNHYAYQQYCLNKKYPNYNSINNNINNNGNINSQQHLAINQYNNSDPYLTNSRYKIYQYEIDQQEFIPTAPYRNHILVSHISDPVFYKPYEWLWIIM
jgi:hypothetical protein